MSAAPNNLCIISQAIKFVLLYWQWVRLLIGCSSFHIFIFALGMRVGWEVWPIKYRQNLENTRMNIARPILAFLKEKCFLPDFSGSCTAKEKDVIVQKELKLLQYSWIFNQVLPGGRKYCNKAAPMPSLPGYHELTT